MSLTKKHQKILLDIARQSIENGYLVGHPLSIDIRNYPSELRIPKATFVTLEKHHQLRGCIGMLEAVLPLVKDVAENAFSAAYKDPRFPPVERSEIPELDIFISILGEPQPIIFHSEADLLQQIRPGIDGLILIENGHKGTFLPSVWESLPDKALFLRHLKNKAGLPADYWSESIKVYRYTTESFGTKAKNND